MLSLVLNWRSHLLKGSISLVCSFRFYVCWWSCCCRRCLRGSHLSLTSTPSTELEVRIDGIYCCGCKCEELEEDSKMSWVRIESGNFPAIMNLKLWQTSSHENMLKMANILVFIAVFHWEFVCKMLTRQNRIKYMTVKKRIMHTNPKHFKSHKQENFYM